MKKILLFLIGIITCFSVNATDITFDATVTTSGNTTVITSINEVKSDKIVNVTYYDLMGKISTKPFNGFNIVTIKYSDGSTKTYKAYNIH